MIRVRDEECERPKDFGCHIALYQSCESFHKGRKYIMRERLRLESVKKPLHNPCLMSGEA
jgi:hypothetical protein